MFVFLHALHEGLRELHLNGRSPLPLPDVRFVLPPDPKPAGSIIRARRLTARPRTRCCR